MEKFVLNYRIILEPENNKSGQKVYNAYCPKLGVADWGKTVEEALIHIQEAIECYLESLAKHHKPIPTGDKAEFLVTTTEVFLQKNLKPIFA